MKPGNATVAYFAGDIKKENLDKVSVNDILSNASRIERARKDPMECDLFSPIFLKFL